MLFHHDQVNDLSIFYFQEPDDSLLDDCVRHLLSRFSERKVWGLIQAACDQLKLPYPSSVRWGCIEMVFNIMTREQAQALLTVYHNGKLKDVLNRVGYMFSVTYIVPIINWAATGAKGNYISCHLLTWTSPVDITQLLPCVVAEHRTWAPNLGVIKCIHPGRWVVGEHGTSTPNLRVIKCIHPGRLPPCVVCVYVVFNKVTVKLTNRNKTHKQLKYSVVNGTWNMHNKSVILDFCWTSVVSGFRCKAFHLMRCL